MNEHGPISVAEGAFMYGRIALASWAARIVFGSLLIFLHMSGGLTLINVFGSFFVAFVIAPGARFQQEMLRMKQQGMDICSGLRLSPLRPEIIAVFGPHYLRP